MRKQHNPERHDAETPEWTEVMVRSAKRFPELPSGLQRKLRGRPVVGEVKAAISLRLPQSTLARWKATGPGWQTRMVQLLAKRVP